MQSASIEDFLGSVEFEWRGEKITAVASVETAKLFNRHLPLIRASRGIDAAIRKEARRQQRLHALSMDDATAIAERPFERWITQTTISVALWAILQGDLLKPVKINGQDAVDCRLDIDVPEEYWDTAEHFEDPWATVGDKPAVITFKRNNPVEVGIALITQITNDPQVKKIVSPIATRLNFLATLYQTGTEDDEESRWFLYRQMDDILSRIVPGDDNPDERESVGWRVRRSGNESENTPRLAGRTETESPSVFEGRAGDSPGS